MGVLHTRDKLEQYSAQGKALPWMPGADYIRSRLNVDLYLPEREIRWSQVLRSEGGPASDVI